MGTADPKVRLRIFNYLRTSGIEIGMANTVASRCVGAMVQPGQLPESIVSIASAAISPNPNLDHIDEVKSLALLEPRAEPFEAWPCRTAQKGAARPSIGGKLSGMSTGATAPTRKFGSPSTGSFGAQIGGGGTTDYAIIEPIISRREISSQKGLKLSRMQLQGFVGALSRRRL